MEYLDLYDKNQKLTGEKIIRGKGKLEIKEGCYINVTIIFIKNSDNKFLIQKTSIEKGSEFATTGGHIKSGDTSRETIINEVREELGIDISNDNLELIDTIIFKSVFFDVYYVEKDIDTNLFVLQKEEVEYIKWLSIEEIKELINNNNLRKSNILGFEKVLKIKKL